MVRILSNLHDCFKKNPTKHFCKMCMYIKGDALCISRIIHHEKTMSITGQKGVKV